MPKASVKSTPKTKIPMLTAWGKDGISTKTYYYGVEVEKSNKTTKLPKTGAQPLFRFKNSKGNIGDWYNVKDLIYVDKVMQGENKQFMNELSQQVLKGKITVEQLKELAASAGLPL